MNAVDLEVKEQGLTDSSLTDRLVPYATASHGNTRPQFVSVFYVFRKYPNRRSY
jgi:hypothetical protein